MGTVNIELADGAYSYGPERAVFSDLSFFVRSGEILSVIGPNGCGKTTLLKCLVGILDFEAGGLDIGGQTGIAATARSRLFGYVPQLTADPVPYSVERMVVLGRARFQRAFGRPEQRDFAVAREAMRTVGIQHLAGRAFNTLSGGERQLVLIAQALATEAHALVFDEPTSALDLVNQHQTVELLRTLSHERTYTIVFSSHDPSHALHIADRCLILGKDVSTYEFGPAETVITEEGIRKAFGVDSRIVRHEYDDGSVALGVTPILKPFIRKVIVST